MKIENLNKRKISFSYKCNIIIISLESWTSQKRIEKWTKGLAYIATVSEQQQNK